MDSYRNPQLADILRRLKNPSESVSDQPPSLASVNHALRDSTILVTQPSSQSDKGLSTADSRRRPIAASLDPSRITTWPAAQKYVIDNIYRSESLASKIRQIIKNQNNQERQWWEERESLIRKHRGRVEKEKQVAVMLQSIGGIATANPMVPKSGEEDVELRRCDLKIHKATTKLAAEIDRELRSLGVPFYAIKHELVILEERKEEGMQEGKLDKSELRELQRRMLQLLEELIKD